MEELTSIKSSFIQEIEYASSHASSSLPFLITPLPEKNNLLSSAIFEVLVIGGSNFQKALCQHHESQVKILSREEGLIPTFHTKDDFLDFVSKHIDQNVNTVALNFAYPIKNEIRENRLDGTLIHGTKEHTFEGLVGQKVGLEIEQYVFEKTGKNIQIYIANDTVCLLLSGLSIGNAQNLACAIVGTGYNAAFFIDQNTVVNLEAANFDKFSQSETGKKIDTESVHPGKGIFEKEISGAYLFHHFRHLAEIAHIQTNHINTTEALNKVAQEENEVGRLAREVFLHSADLVSTHIAGIAEYKKSDMVFVVEGSLFWKGYQYKERVEEDVRRLSAYSVEFVKIEDSGIIGAAHLI